jgi:type IX secretion system PorP/SprF family membrane protein
MKLFIRCCFLIVLTGGALVTQAQQDIVFSQFYELPMLRNPALAGIFNGNFRLTGAYRNQWQSVTVPYRTMALGAEIKILRGLYEGDFLTTGVQVTNDIAGDSKLQRTQIFPVLNYHKLLNEEKSTFLSIAFMGGPVNERFDPGKLQFDDQFVNGAYASSNPTRQQFNSTHFTYLDASVGVSFKTLINESINVYAGTGLFHITRPRVAFTHDYDVRLNKKWVINAGLSAWTSEVDKIVVYADYFIQGGDRLAQGGVLLSHSFDETGAEATMSIAAGATYRWKDAFIPVLKLYTNKLGIGLSYDVNISKLRTASQYRGGFELTLSYTGFWKSLSEGLDKVECPINIW